MPTKLGKINSTCLAYSKLSPTQGGGGGGRKHVLAHKIMGDGFLAWHEMMADCNHDGSAIVRIEKLKFVVNQPFLKKYSGKLLVFVDRFQTSIEELGSLKASYYEVKLDALTIALRKVPSETSYYLDYIQDEGLDFSRACAYLQERALLKSTFDDNDT